MNVLGWLRWREGARIIAIEGGSLTETGRAGMADIAADAGSVARRRYEARLRPSIELLEGLLKRQPFLAGMNIAIGALAALALSGAVPTAWLLGWLACLLASQALRFALHARGRAPSAGWPARPPPGPCPPPCPPAPPPARKGSPAGPPWDSGSRPPRPSPASPGACSGSCSTVSATRRKSSFPSCSPAWPAAP